ncbi:MAG: ABC transporter ATP-binding protein [Acidobacteria bacterium]|nr:ABC transporter ATP-binding protein [Acidobacteriota bacterium]
MKVRCTNLNVSYPDGAAHVEALRNLSFECGDGEFLSILGPSGCGKTTLLRVLAGLVIADKGRIERFSPPTNGNGRILLIFQEDSLFPWMTVIKNAAFGLEMQAVPKSLRETQAGELLRRFGVAGRENSYPHQLSLGMKQRVAVIRCFLSKPGLMLMDEPFGSLDAQMRSTLQQELLALWDQNRNSVIFVTHDVEEALLLSDRILVLSAQPGTVVGEVHVPLPRPRSAETSLTEEFLQLKRRIVHLLRQQQAPDHVA